MRNQTKLVKTKILIEKGTKKLKKRKKNQIITETKLMSKTLVNWDQGIIF